MTTPALALCPQCALAPCGCAVWAQLEAGALEAGSPDQPRDARGRWSSTGVLYHVTFTEHVPSIAKMGLVRKAAPTNWAPAGKAGTRYGGGQHFAFTHRADALRWAGKMDWEFNKKFGSGKISLVHVREQRGWKEDEADPLSQAGSHGTWLKRSTDVPASDILKHEVVTDEMIRHREDDLKSEAAVPVCEQCHQPHPADEPCVEARDVSDEPRGHGGKWAKLSEQIEEALYPHDKRGRKIFKQIGPMWKISGQTDAPLIPPFDEPEDPATLPSSYIQPLTQPCGQCNLLPCGCNTPPLTAEAVLAAEAALLAYSEDQERNAQGRWTSGGGTVEAGPPAWHDGKYAGLTQSEWDSWAESALDLTESWRGNKPSVSTMGTEMGPKDWEEGTSIVGRIQDAAAQGTVELPAGKALLRAEVFEKPAEMWARYGGDTVTYRVPTSFTSEPTVMKDYLSTWQEFLDHPVPVVVHLEAPERRYAGVTFPSWPEQGRPREQGKAFELIVPAARTYHVASHPHQDGYGNWHVTLRQDRIPHTAATFTAAAAEWEEEEHPRDPAGKFTQGAGGLRIYHTLADVKEISDWGAKKWQWRGHGDLLRGKPIDHDDLPDTLYHATTALDALHKADALVAQDADKGLGGGTRPGVSLTRNRADAELITTALLRGHEIVTQAHDEPAVKEMLTRFARQDERDAGIPQGSLDRAVEAAVFNYHVNAGNEYPGSEPLATRAPGLARDAYNFYLQIRDTDGLKLWEAAHPGPNVYRRYQNESDSPLRNPMVFTPTEQLAAFEPKNIGIISVSKSAIPREALLEPGDEYLHEVRVHADVPLRGANLAAEADDLDAEAEGHHTWDEVLHPRDERGRFTTAGGASDDTKVHISRRDVADRAHVKDPVPLEHQLTKQETGRLGERLTVQYLRQHGFKDARYLNHVKPNEAADIIADHLVIEAKAGLVSNSTGAQKWRSSIGGVTKKEREMMARMTPERRKAYNLRKARDIMLRKQELMAKTARQLHHDVRGGTFGWIIDTDRHVADLYRFEGFHKRVGWHGRKVNGQPVKDTYVTSVHFDGPLK